MSRGLAPLAFLLVLVLGGCSQMDVRDFRGQAPRLVLEEYFDGKVQAWGMFHDRFGNLRRQFRVEIDGTWEPGTRTLTLVEDFDYADGETERRVWTIRKTGEQAYTGRADGVVGTARGEGAGNAFNWRYDFELEIGDSVWTVHFDDWLFLQEGGVLLNRASVSKFGLTLGEATIVFVKGDVLKDHGADVEGRAGMAVQ